MVFFFLESVTEESCISPIFFIFSSISIFCSSFFISVFNSLTVSSLWCCRATAVAHAEWIAVIQFSSSVWLEVWREGKGNSKNPLKMIRHEQIQFQREFFSFDLKNQKGLKSTFIRRNKNIIFICEKATFSSAPCIQLLEWHLCLRVTAAEYFLASAYKLLSLLIVMVQ